MPTIKWERDRSAPQAELRTAYVPVSKSRAKYRVRVWKAIIDGKKTWFWEVRRVDARGFLSGYLSGHHRPRMHGAQAIGIGCARALAKVAR